MKTSGTTRDLTDALTMMTTSFHALSLLNALADSVRGCHGSHSAVELPKKPQQGHALEVRALPAPRTASP